MILTQYDYSSLYKTILKLLIIIIVLITIKVTYDKSHAVLKHTIAAYQTRKCIDQNKPTIILHNKNTNRYLRFCEIKPGKWGQQILDKTKNGFNEVTAYIRGNVHSEEDIINYAKNNNLEIIPP